VNAPPGIWQKSVEGYVAAPKKRLTGNNGKLVREFDRLYDSIHIDRHYSGCSTYTKQQNVTWCRVRIF